MFFCIKHLSNFLCSMELNLVELYSNCLHAYFWFAHCSTCSSRKNENSTPKSFLTKSKENRSTVNSNVTYSIFCVWLNNNYLLNWVSLHLNNEQSDSRNQFGKSQRQLRYKRFELYSQYRSMYEFLPLYIVESIVPS
jgi:hypothetical protein